MRITFLGTGTSVGVPMIGCSCQVCRSNDPHDKRLRTGLLIENGEQRLIIDISADFRQQALRERIDRIDALLITHCHADHVLGLDDIRPLNFRQGPIPLFASESTLSQLRRIFHYIFEIKNAGSGLPQVISQTIDGEFEVCGMKVTPIPVIHGQMEVMAFRLSDGSREVAFVTDCNVIPEASLDKLRGLDLLIIDALRYDPHPTHLHLAQTLAYIARVEPRHALLTHVGHDIKYADANQRLPDCVELAYDGLKIDI
ncbi:MAG: MBL fold metallo-hydrolase [Blastocatellia bacterium]|nr:MBL fold metallo-hydrolase [Blastocatellia bacterium]